MLIDDGSTDGTADMVRELVRHEKLTTIIGKGDWWWAGSLQQGLNKLEEYEIKPSDIVLMINDDVIFEDDFLENAVKFIYSHHSTLLLAKFYEDKLGKVVESGVKADLKRLNFIEAELQEEINCLSTRGLFLRWDVSKKIGGFHPFILPHYGSDYEYTIRARRKGFVLRTDSDVYIKPDHTTTGIRVQEQVDNLKTLFSKKCAMNPIYRTSFILLVSPILCVPVNVARVWFRALRIIIK